MKDLYNHTNEGLSLPPGAVQARPGLATCNGFFLRAPSTDRPHHERCAHALCRQACGYDGPRSAITFNIEEHIRPYPAPWYD